MSALHTGGIVPAGRPPIVDGGCVWPPPGPEVRIEIHASVIPSEAELVECIRKALRSPHT